jgi:hypothetical protein
VFKKLNFENVANPDITGFCPITGKPVMAGKKEKFS